MNSLRDFCLRIGESHFVMVFQISKLLICTANKILGASEELFSNTNLTMKINVGINPQDCCKSKEHDSPVKIAG